MIRISMMMILDDDDAVLIERSEYDDDDVSDRKIRSCYDYDVA